VALKLLVSKADITWEAGFPKPEFSLFRDTASLLDCIYRRLQPHGLQLANVRFERGAGNVGDQHVLIHLLNFLMTVRIRPERIEVICADLRQDLADKFKLAALDALRAVKDCNRDLTFRAFASALDIHATLEGQSVREYLARFVTTPTTTLGPSTGNGVVFYFGPHGDRLLSTITADRSALVPEGVFIRLHGVWDAGRTPTDALPGTVEAFIREALDGLGLHLPG
jgi:hypothetical protein